MLCYIGARIFPVGVMGPDLQLYRGPCVLYARTTGIFRIRFTMCFICTRENDDDDKDDETTGLGDMFTRLCSVSFFLFSSSCLRVRRETSVHRRGNIY